MLDLYDEFIYLCVGNMLTCPHIIIEVLGHYRNTFRRFLFHLLRSQQDTANYHSS
ncbi:hypothetical protein BRADI_3g36535v3 [Brachypodium distachyon]|uniref:Uncharacterized protein n=1 Tax=Brachypodium distachyon TaxID=15368 RepID=A0A2K2D1K1_BRADI|nr:hypothetical protein BRADI_3g36535v3 [Brachypodium distachyon]